MCYINYPIPPPIDACVEIGITMDKLLFKKHDFLRCGDRLGRPLTSAEYNELMLDHKDLSDIRVFGDYLKTLHNWKCKLELNMFEDNVINETAFVSLISSFTSEIDIALKLHS